MGLFGLNGPCEEHDHETLRPIIVDTWMPEKVGGLPGKSLVFAETQVNLSKNFSIFNIKIRIFFKKQNPFVDCSRKYCNSGIESPPDVSE